MKHRPQRRSSELDHSATSVTTGLGALNIATWEAQGRPGKLTARLGPASCPPDFLSSAGRELKWDRMIFPADQLRVAGWLEKLTARSKTREPLEYRLKLSPRRVVWIRHWAQLAPAAPAVSRSNPRTATLLGLVQLIDAEKQFEAASLRSLEAERETLGQELHDHTCQVLAGLSCLTQAFSHSPSRQSAAGLKSLLADLNHQLAAATNRVRTRAHALVPGPAMRQGLPSALRSLARQFQLLYDVEIELRLPSIPPRHGKLQVVQLHAIASESIVNAVKHGRATQLSVTLRASGKSRLLEIRDNGAGFPSPAPSRGIGLHVMRHRAALIGATMTVENCQPKGARVRINYSVA